MNYDTWSIVFGFLEPFYWPRIARVSRGFDQLRLYNLRKRNVVYDSTRRICYFHIDISYIHCYIDGRRASRLTRYFLNGRAKDIFSVVEEHVHKIVLIDSSGTFTYSYETRIEIVVSDYLPMNYSWSAYNADRDILMLFKVDSRTCVSRVTVILRPNTEQIDESMKKNTDEAIYAKGVLLYDNTTNIVCDIAGNIWLADSHTVVGGIKFDK